MERGVARIAWGIGEIDAEAGVTPVGFDPHTFSNIQNGEAVYFRRSSSREDWAVMVAPASLTDQLVAAATPPSGFTAPALRLVRGAAAQFAVEAQFAPLGSLGQEHMTHALAAMERIRGALEPGLEAPCGEEEVAPLLP